MPTQSVTQYRIEVKVAGKDLTQFLTRFRTVNSIYNCWPIVDLTFEMDNQEVIETDIYGQNPIELIIHMSRETDKESEKSEPPIKMQLLYLESPLDLVQKYEHNQMGKEDNDYQRQPVFIRTIPYPCVNVMTSFVNKLLEEPARKKPVTVIRELIKEKGFQKTSIIEDENKNDYFINQLVIPPMSLKQCIEYLNEKYPIFKGPLFYYCTYDGYFLMWDLYKHFEKGKDDPRIIFYKLATAYEDENTLIEILRKVVNEEYGQGYVGYDTVESLYYGNSSIVNYGYDNVYITHPRSDLYYLLTKNTEEIVKELGIKHDSDQVKFYADLKSRKRYITDCVGFENEGYEAEYSDTIITSRMSSNFKDMSSLRFTLRRNISPKTVMRVGDVVKVEPSSEHEEKYGGSYLISNSDFIIDKHPGGASGDNYIGQCFITAFRSVQEKNQDEG